jgi:hypothetical protein
MLALQQYSSDENDSDDGNKDNLEDLTAHLKPIDKKDHFSWINVAKRFRIKNRKSSA